MKEHIRFTQDTEIDKYFCNAPRPSHKGTNENTNCLLPQDFPEKTSLHEFDRNYLDKIANKFNKRPR